MYIDDKTRLSDSQAVTADAVGTNVYDMGVARSIGSGEPMAIMFTVDVAADQVTGDEDYTFDIEFATNAAQSTGRQLVGRRVFESGTPTAPAQDADLLVAGFRFYVPIPPVTLAETGRYLGIRYDVAGTTPTITVSADIVPMRTIDSTANYTGGYTIT